MTFPAKKVKICGLKAAFMFKKQIVHIFILLGRKKRGNSL